MFLYGLVSVASLADWKGFLLSSGTPTSAHDAAQTHGPTICLALFNVVVRSPLWTPRSFELIVSCCLLMGMLTFALPAIIEFRSYPDYGMPWQPALQPALWGDPNERLVLGGIGLTCRSGCDHGAAGTWQTGCIEDDMAGPFIACSELMPRATISTLCAGTSRSDTPAPPRLHARTHARSLLTAHRARPGGSSACVLRVPAHTQEIVP